MCTLSDPAVPALAAELGTTRSAAALELWRDRLDGAVVAVGNAPTALFRLLELIEEGAPRPAAVIGVPVGFIGAAESKDALAAHASGLDHLIVRGRMGRQRHGGRRSQRDRQRGRVSVSEQKNSRSCTESDWAPVIRP